MAVAVGVLVADVWDVADGVSVDGPDMMPGGVAVGVDVAVLGGVAVAAEAGQVLGLDCPL